MNPYVLLTGTIASEFAGAVTFKLSTGFSEPLPSLGVMTGYGLTFYLISPTLEELPIDVAHETWVALGIVDIAAIGVVTFNEPVGLMGAVGLLLILAGVCCVNVLSEMAAH